MISATVLGHRFYPAPVNMDQHERDEMEARKNARPKLSGPQKVALDILIARGCALHYLPVHGLVINALFRKGYMDVTCDGRYTITELGRYVRS